ncbi:hypothetical protein B0H11DRAFT_2085969 [Mycena galericulata]|nr:hypothetical protein B0H11DRAFT_2085969 [Mycena galericulata]
MASEVFGSLVAAVCLNIVLYTLEVVMACQFFWDNNPSETGRLAKFGVCLNLIIDTAATIAGFTFLYMFQDSHWGDNDEVQSRFWRAIVGVLTAGTAVSAISQSFLLSRFWKNIRKHLLGTAFAVTILIMAVLASVAAVVICGYLQWTSAPILLPFFWIALIANVIAAIGITTVSLCQRLAIKTTVGPRKQCVASFFTVFPSLEYEYCSMIIRTVRSFIQTGFPSAIIVVMALIAWAAGRKGDLVVALYFIEARVYSCTMLLTLRYPPPSRTDEWIDEMVSASVPQKELPLPPISPDIFLKDEKARNSTLCEIPEDKPVEGWFNIDLGTGAARSSSDNDKEISPNAVVVHRNASFYQVPDEEKR